MANWLDSDYRNNSNMGTVSDMPLERIEALENNSTFKADTSTKITSVVKGVGTEAKNSLDTFVKVGDNISNAIINLSEGAKTSSQYFKYLPFLVVGYFAIKLMKGNKRWIF